jgi:hypothetical protein
METVEMKAENFARYIVQPNTFELHPGKVAIELEKPFRVTVILPENPAIFKEGERELSFWVQGDYKKGHRVVFDSGEIHIKTEKPNDWQRFLETNFSQLIGLFVAARVCIGQEDFIWVEPSGEETVWFLGMQWDICKDKKIGCGMLVERRRPHQVHLDVSFWFIDKKDKQLEKKFANQLFALIRDENGLNLPGDFPFCRQLKLTCGLPDPRQLTIKLHSSQLWFLLFPFEYFRMFVEYDSFCIYRGIEWVITDDKSYIQNLCEQEMIRSELNNLKNSLKYSVIILNTYQSFEKEEDISKKVKEGTSLVIEILDLLQNVNAGGEELSIRWYLNPTFDVVFSELLNQNTRYFFANFHTEDGEWITPEGERSFGHSFFEKKEKSTLAHIRLMKLFHCDSVARIDSLQTRPSIVSLLIEAGALRVEGGIGGEDYIDYLCSLLFLFKQSRGLSFIIKVKCYEIGKDIVSLTENIGIFLVSCGWPLPDKQ